MKTKMIQEMTSEERMEFQSKMEAFAPKLERLEKVANAQSPTMAWTPACGNYLPEGLRLLCSFQDAKPFAEDTLTNGKTADATKEFIVFWKMETEKLSQMISEKESAEESDSDAQEGEADGVGLDVNSDAITEGDDRAGEESEESKNKTQTRRGRK